MTPTDFHSSERVMTGWKWPPLMPIVDATVATRAGWTMGDLATAYAAGGATLMQVRAKDVPAGAFLDTVSGIVHAVGPECRVIVNDRADIARLACAAGLHIGQEDMGLPEARRVLGAGMMIGVSTHTPEQLAEAIQCAASESDALDYAAIGPVFDTATKDTGYRVLGLERVRAGALEAGRAKLPLVAIGGVTLREAPTVIQAGATAIAVISDLLATGDPEGRVREYLQCLTI